MKKLIATVGLPRSGKTTWARQQGHPIVSPDAIRLALHGERFIASAEPTVWATAYVMVDALFLAGHDTVVLDATNVSTKRRDMWMRKVGDVFDVVKLQVFDTSPDECKRRALDTMRPDLVPVIDRMAAEWDAGAVPWKLPELTTPPR